MADYITQQMLESMVKQNFPNCTAKLHKNGLTNDLVDSQLKYISQQGYVREQARAISRDSHSDSTKPRTLRVIRPFRIPSINGNFQLEVHKSRKDGSYAFSVYSIEHGQPKKEFTVAGMIYSES